ncbi:DUF2213 domain-containing protein [Acetobacter sp. UBA5411]|uniref:DUF2213 domain-containing protein n=1 Tax=Acetobacter sp. UBA5411 TaxID=1945905 RepID=UPI0025C34540|nr:DUF2213 domain-containing protein [Acetobacter sp. UBA5411]
MTDKLAFDRSVRRIDADGHLHVERCVISAAVVSPYYGREIPGSEELSLEPDTIYWLYRDADALREAAASMNGKPIIEVHQPISAEDHPKEITVGAVNNVRFDDPDLIGELSIWDGDAIDRIEDGSKRCVSSGYAYRAVPEEGEISGQKYTLKMVDIRFNHLALVENPRVQTAIIGDSAITTMENDIMAVRKPMTAAGRVLAALKSGRLGMDASEEDVKKCMDEDEDDKKEDEKAADAKACDEDSKKAEDEDEDDKKAEDEEEDKPKPGMDAASVRLAIDAAVSKERKRNKQAQDAREAVRPLVGDVIGLDNAPDIYRYALKNVGVDAENVHPSALPAMVSMAMASRQQKPRVAMDAAPDSDSPLAGVSARRKA